MCCGSPAWSKEYRKRKLAKLVRGPQLGIVLNEGDGEIIFKHACKLGCEGMRIKMGWVALSVGAVATLDQDQKSESTGGQA